MSITDELREFIEDKAWMANNYAKALAIADRIDAEHESKVSYWQGASHKDGYDEGFKDGYDEGFASADDWLGQHESDMAEHGWVRLPVDADGEYIHIGDVMDFTVNVRDLVVLGIGMVDVGGERDMGVFVRSGREYEWYNASFLHHHHAPTVEDVLREMLYKAHIYDEREMELLPDLIAEYAAKLQLKEDA